jgi:hypothetical protein
VSACPDGPSVAAYSTPRVAFVAATLSLANGVTGTIHSATLGIHAFGEGLAKLRGGSIRSTGLPSWSALVRMFRSYWTGPSPTPMTMRGARRRDSQVGQRHEDLVTEDCFQRNRRGKSEAGQVQATEAWIFELDRMAHRS